MNEPLLLYAAHVRAKQVHELQQRIATEGIRFQKSTDVTRTFWLRGPQQWKDWVLRRDEACSAPTAASQLA